MKLLIDLSDFNPSNTYEDLALSTIAVFIFLWVIEWTTFFILGFFPGEIVATRRNKTILSRHTMDFISMAVFSYLGYQGLEIVGWDSYTHLKSNVTAEVLKLGAERSYVYIAAAQRLCMFHIAYESKNFCDSVIHNDGIVFLLHHICTGVLAAFALHPVFHIYSLYFLGISEISTSVLCILVCFDNDHGVGALAKQAPTLMKVLGILFAILFIVFRVGLWPIVSYIFFQDALELLRTGTAHLEYVVYTFLVFNIGLSLLQFVWLWEIITTATKLLTSKDSTLSISRGDKKDQ